MREFVVGTRSSKLALIQTENIVDRLRQSGIQSPIRVKEIVTKGDKRVDVALTTLESGVFLQEMEAELAEETIDLAVHSLKDVPAVLPEGLHIASVPEREDIRDAYLANDHVPLNELPVGATIGTSSVRRVAQLHRMRPDIQTKPIRGPIDSRVEQMQKGHYDAILLAVSGIKRLGLGLDLITEYLDPDRFIPAIGQAALAIESRSDDTEVNDMLQRINDPKSEKAVQTERLFLSHYSEEEVDPIAGYAVVQDEEITFKGIVISMDGKQVLEHTVVGDDPQKLAEEMYQALTHQGANDIIQQVKAELGRT